MRDAKELNVSKMYFTAIRNRERVLPKVRRTRKATAGSKTNVVSQRISAQEQVSHVYVYSCESKKSLRSAYHFKDGIRVKGHLVVAIKWQNKFLDLISV